MILTLERQGEEVEEEAWGGGSAVGEERFVGVFLEKSQSL